MTSIIKNYDHYYERTKAIVILALQKTKKGTRIVSDYRIGRRIHVELKS